MSGNAPSGPPTGWPSSARGRGGNTITASEREVLRRLVVEARELRSLARKVGAAHKSLAAEARELRAAAREAGAAHEGYKSRLRNKRAQAKHFREAQQ